jgi:hypothetical protein
VETFLASLFVCLMFGALGLMFWVFWDEGRPENIRRLQDEERGRCRQEALRRRKEPPC